MDDSSCGADRILGSNQSAHNPMSPHSLYIYLHKNPFTHESCVALKKTHVCLCPSSGKEVSVIFSGMEKGSPLVLAGGEDSLEFFTIRLRGAVACVAFLSAIQVGSSLGLRLVSLLFGCLPELKLKLFTLSASSYFSLPSSADMKKTFFLGKVRTERIGKGPGRAWGIFPVME